VKIINRISRVIIFIIIYLFFFQISFADQKTPKVKVKSVKSSKIEKKIVTTKSDSVLVGTKGQFVEFIGHFIGVYGDSKLMADRVKIFYYSRAEKEKLKKRVVKRQFKNDTVKKIVAKGNVVIIAPEKKIITDIAVYVDKTGLLVLTGKNTMVETGDNKISGSRIEYNVNTGQMSVEGANTIINPDDKSGFKF
jgi:lipopolysaccharide transport protein LptA